MDESFYKQDTVVDVYAPVKKEVSIPAQIGPYKIESTLNKGGMSILYLGIRPDNRELLVLKVLSPQFVTHPELCERFLKEAKIIHMANHPNIVKIYGQGQWEGGLYIAMEFIRGVSLRQFIAQQSLSLKRSIDIILQVAYALHHLHAHGIIHGDLKPENILITEDGMVKVIDFGIARLHEETRKKPEKKGKIAGTPNYMSPEQKEDPAKVTFASDVYSLGIIAYELAMGKLSFGIIHLSLVPKGLRKIIEKALAISLEERYPDITSFITDISDYLKSGGLEKDKPGSDQLKEILETLQRSTLALCPSLPPSWPLVDIGLVRYKGPGQLGSFLEFFKLANNSYAIVIGKTTALGVDSGIFLGVLRGTVRTLFDEKNGLALKPATLIPTLNRLFKDDPLEQKFGLALLLLDPLRETLSFTSCGFGGLIHIQQGSEAPRKLPNKNPLLGVDANAEFFATNDRWEVGSLLTLHSLDPQLEEMLHQVLVANHLLSAQGQAEAILKQAVVHPSFLPQKEPSLLITIHRIS